jgi:hypothetical protein
MAPALANAQNCTCGGETCDVTCSVADLQNRTSGLEVHTSGWVNVLSYGANGDDDHDDTVAIQAAIATGRPVRFGPGMFYFSSQISLAAGQIVSGAGIEVTTLRYAGTTENAVNIRDVTGSGLRDLTVSASGVPSGSGIWFQGGGVNELQRVKVAGPFSEGVTIVAAAPLLDVVTINGTRAYGLHIQSAGGVPSVGSVWRRVHVLGNSGGGVLVDGVVTGLVTDTLQIESNGGAGLTIQSNSDGQPSEGFHSKLIADSNGTDGVRISAGTMQYFEGVWASNRGSGKNFYVAGGVGDVTLSGGRIYNCNGHGIEITGDRVSLVGTSIENVGVNAAHTYDGVYVTGSRVDLIGVRAAGGNTRWGATFDAGAHEYRVLGGQMTGTAGAGVNDVANDAGSTLLASGVQPKQRLNGTVILNRNDLDGAVQFVDGKAFIYGAGSAGSGWIGVATNNIVRVVIDGNGLHPSKTDFTSQTGAGIYVGPVAPTAGTFSTGSRVLNSAPAVGKPKGWICTMGGTPGTWVSEGNL